MEYKDFKDGPELTSDPESAQKPTIASRQRFGFTVVFLKRILAFFLDTVIISTVCSIIIALTGYYGDLVSVVVSSIFMTCMDQLIPGAQLLLILAVITPLSIIPLINLLYHVGFEASSWQATPGKRFLGLHVETINGKRLSIVRAILRHFSKGIVFTVLLFIWTLGVTGNQIFQIVIAYFATLISLLPICFLMRRMFQIPSDFVVQCRVVKLTQE